MFSAKKNFKKRKDKPIGGGHCLENSSELTTRVGSTPTLSATIAMWRSGLAQPSYTGKIKGSNPFIATKNNQRIIKKALVANLVKRHPVKVRNIGSNPI